MANKKWSLNFRQSIFITHHSFFHTHLATSLLFSSLNFFTLFMGPTPISQYSFFFSSTQLTEANIKKKKKKLTANPGKEKKKKKKNTNSQRQPRKRKRKKKKKKKNPKPTPTQEKKKPNSQPRKRKEKKKKKSKGGQKLRLWVPYVCLITILPLSYELWKQSYRLAKQPFYYGSHHF